jgi:hypothetical protein
MDCKNERKEASCGGGSAERDIGLDFGEMSKVETMVT